LKIIANYLPQFHRIPENDTWWGVGFTEWTTVKNAKPLYEGHEQPRVPLNENYYDLLDKKTMEWQAELMQRYGVDGLCFYHYWFKDGKKLLEKPAENLLEWKEINMPFCFCWANETWARTWSNAGKWPRNAWADSFEPKRLDDRYSDPRGVLVEQQYGDKDEWTKHFEYLFRFFTDDRYIRVDGKPLVVIHRATEIDRLEDMIDWWRHLALDRGLDGIYVLGGGYDRDISNCIDGFYHRAPADLRQLFARFPGRNGNSIPIPYEAVWETILNSLLTCDSQPYFSGVVSYDTTPRQGEKGTIYEGANPDAFENCLYKLLIKNQTYGSDITFVNAWNEWGESMYLEPDTKWGYSFLEAVGNAKRRFSEYEKTSGAPGAKREIDLLRKSFADQYDRSRRADNNVSLMERWLTLYEQGKDVLGVFETSIKGDIAIYGYGVLGRRLVSLLNNREIHISYVIDKNIDHIVDEKENENGIFVKNIEDIPTVDNAIVAISGNCDNIKYDLAKNGVKRVVTLEEIIESAERGSGII
jgi:hypothetical protein